MRKRLEYPPWDSHPGAGSGVGEVLWYFVHTYAWPVIWRSISVCVCVCVFSKRIIFFGGWVDIFVGSHQRVRLFLGVFLR